MWTSPTKPPASCDGHQFESPQLHQEVGAKRRDFLCHRIARHFRSLPVLARASGPNTASRSCNVCPRVSHVHHHNQPDDPLYLEFQASGVIFH